LVLLINQRGRTSLADPGLILYPLFTDELCFLFKRIYNCKRNSLYIGKYNFALYPPKQEIALNIISTDHLKTCDKNKSTPRAPKPLFMALKRKGQVKSVFGKLMLGKKVA